MYDIFDKWIYLNFVFGRCPGPRGVWVVLTYAGERNNSTEYTVIYDFKCMPLSAFRGQLLAMCVCVWVVGHCLWPRTFCCNMLPWQTMRSHVADQLRNKLRYINYANVKKFLAIPARPLRDHAPTMRTVQKKIELNRLLEIGLIWGGIMTSLKWFKAFRVGL